MSNRGQVDGIILAVSVLTLVIIAIFILSPDSMTGLVTAGSAASASPSPTPEVLVQYTATKTPTPYASAVPTKVPQVGTVPVIDSTYYNVPIAQPTTTPYNYNNYQYPYNYNNNQYAYFPNGTIYYVPGYQNQPLYFYPNGTPMYYYPYNYYPYNNYTYGAYQGSINVISGQAPVNVFLDGTYRGAILAAGGSYLIYGATTGYHTVYVSGPGCDTTQQIYVSSVYQTTVNICGSVTGGNSYTGDGTYYIYQGDQITSNGGTIFRFTGFSTWEAGTEAAPQATFSITPSGSSTQTAALTAGSVYSYTGGQIRINGAVLTSSNNILFGVTVSNTGYTQPTPLGSRTFNGRVVDTNGTGIFGASVMIVNSQNANSYMNTVLTGNNGQFTFSYVPEGTYNITADQSGYRKQYWNSQAINNDIYLTLSIAPK
jgi:hypothetical protein